jgi:hypothetical protein
LSNQCHVLHRMTNVASQTAFDAYLRPR